jgi:hypothetical protein
MATSPPPFTPFTGSAPQRGDKSTFSQRFDAFITWFIAVTAPLASLAANVYANALEAFNSANAATTAASTALAISGAAAWVSGTSYALNAVAISQVNFQAYRRKVAGAGTVDPANDSTNWVLIVGNATNGAFVGVPVSGTVIDLSLGNYFIDTINGAKTYTFTNCPSDCYAFILDLTVTSGTPAFPGTVKVTGNYPITMNAGKSQMLAFVTKDRGVNRWRMSVAPNFDI